MNRSGPGRASRALPIRVAFYVHIVPAGLALTLGPWQFSQRLRNRRKRLHRGFGRTYVVSDAIGAVSAFVMSMSSSVGLPGFRDDAYLSGFPWARSS